MSCAVQFVTIGGVRLRLATAGSGPPLLFLFGSGAAGNIEKAQPFIDKFSKHFSVACLDQRGLGESDIPPGPWTMADYARDAWGIADHLGWDRFSIIGISFGGMVALEMATTGSDRINGMVVWGATPGGPAHSYPLHELLPLPNSQRNRMFAELMDTRLDGRWETDEPQVEFIKAVLEHGGSPWSVAAGDDESRAWGLIMQLEARRLHDVTLRYRSISCPVFIGAGKYDGLAPLHNVEVMHKGLPHSELRVYEAGHFFYLGAKAFNDGLSFLTGRHEDLGVGSLVMDAKQALFRLGGRPVIDTDPL